MTLFTLVLPVLQDVLENLIVCRCFNSDHQISTIQKLAAFMIEDGPFAMVIIDSGEHALPTFLLTLADSCATGATFDCTMLMCLLI